MKIPYRAIFRLSAPGNIGFFAFFSIIMAAGILPMAENEIRLLSGGTGMLDYRNALNPENTYAHLTQLRAPGRSMYALVAATAKMLFPFTYALFFAGLTGFLLQKLSLARKGRRLLLLPIFVALADLLENAGLLSMLTLYPQNPPPLARLSGLLTLLKWAGMGIYFITILALVGKWSAKSLIFDRTDQKC
jgi:hypothetical protein